MEKLAKKSVQQTSLSNEIFHDVRRDIVMCRLWPGAKLHVDKLADRFNVSLSSVREALSRLSAEGLVVAIPQRGFWVAPVALDDLKDLTKARVEVESICVKWSVDHADEAWEALLTATHEQLRALDPIDPRTRRVTDEWEAKHSEFHDVLVARCDCHTLKQVRKQLFEKAERYRRLSAGVVQHHRDVVEEHLMIYRAAVKRDGALTAALLASHIRETSSSLMLLETDLSAVMQADRS